MAMKALFDEATKRKGMLALEPEDGGRFTVPFDKISFVMPVNDQDVSAIIVLTEEYAGRSRIELSTGLDNLKPLLAENSFVDVLTRGDSDFGHQAAEVFTVMKDAITSFWLQGSEVSAIEVAVDNMFMNNNQPLLVFQTTKELREMVDALEKRELPSPGWYAVEPPVQDRALV